MVIGFKAQMGLVEFESNLEKSLESAENLKLCFKKKVNTEQMFRHCLWTAALALSRLLF